MIGDVTEESNEEYYGNWYVIETPNNVSNILVEREYNLDEEINIKNKQMVNDIADYVAEKYILWR